MIYATLGGVTVGICVLIRYLIKWWPGRKQLMSKPLEHLGRLLPFIYGWCYGALGTLTVMGVLGWGFDTALWVSNWLGDAILFLGVGESPGQVSQGVTQPLTAVGNCTVVVLTVATITAIKYTKAGKDIKAGVWSGCCLGTSAGIAGLTAVPLATAVNAIGATLYGVIS